MASRNETEVGRQLDGKPKPKFVWKKVCGKRDDMGIEEIKERLKLWRNKRQNQDYNFVDFPLTVACTGVDVDYAHGGAYVLMDDGSPAAYDLTVSFTETTQMARQKYKEQVSPPTRTGEGITASERGTVTVDQEIHRDDGTIPPDGGFIGVKGDGQFGP